LQGVLLGKGAATLIRPGGRFFLVLVNVVFFFGNVWK